MGWSNAGHLETPQCEVPVGILTRVWPGILHILLGVWLTTLGILFRVWVTMQGFCQCDLTTLAFSVKVLTDHSEILSRVWLTTTRFCQGSDWPLRDSVKVLTNHSDYVKVLTDHSKILSRFWQTTEILSRFWLTTQRFCKWFDWPLQDSVKGLTDHSWDSVNGLTDHSEILSRVKHFRKLYLIGRNNHVNAIVKGLTDQKKKNHFNCILSYIWVLYLIIYECLVAVDGNISFKCDVWWKLWHPKSSVPVQWWVHWSIY